MSQEAFESGMNILQDRSIYEQKLRLFYTMRHDGLPRERKPFPTAADGHYPMIDMTIRRLKPFWVGQVTSGERLCSMISMQDQLDGVTDSAADYLDFTIRQKTSFLRKLRVAIDHMLLKGRGILKITIDPTQEYKIVVEAVDPFFLLMPQEADGFEDADEFIHVRQFTVDSYRRLDARWDTSEQTVQMIRGKPVSQLNVQIDQKRLREGVNYTSNTEQVIVWEHWMKTSGGHTIETYSPLAPTIKLRQNYGNPFKFQKKESIPFFSFEMEVKDEGWYSPRGVAELVAPVEQYMTKLWNEKADAITFANRQIFTGDAETLNSSNYRWVSGEYVPGNIQQVQMRAAPFDFDDEINFAGGIAEQQSQSPDFGIVSNGDSGQTGGKPRTATENNRIGSLQQAGSNDNANMFREDLIKPYKHIWALICQFKERDLSYYAAGQTGKLPPEALHEAYLMEPDGSPDGWNQMARFQKYLSGLQAFQGNPNVDMEPFTKRALNAFDGRLALKAFIPTNLKGASEYEDEALIISSLICPGSGKPSFPATVKPNEDQPSRIKAIIDWIHAAGVKGTPIDPQSKSVLHERLAQRIAILAKQNPAAAKQIQQSLGAMENAPQGGAPASGQPPASPQGSGGAGSSPPKESISINYKDAPDDIKRQMEVAAGFKPSSGIAPNSSIPKPQPPTTPTK